MKRIAASLMLALLASPHEAWSGEADACIDAIERGERLKKQSRLREARKELAACTSETCPAPLRSMCRQFLDEVEASLPTIEVRVYAGDGRRLRDVHVVVDDALVSESTDDAIAVDAGEHVVRIEHDGASQEATVEVAPGQKAMPMIVRFPSPAPSPPRTVESPVAASPSPTRRTEQSPLPYALGGVALLALGGASVFGFRWLSVTDCKPSCSPSQTTSIRSDAVVTDVLLGTGIVAAGVAAIWLLTSRPAGAR